MFSNYICCLSFVTHITDSRSSIFVSLVSKGARHICVNKRLACSRLVWFIRFSGTTWWLDAGGKTQKRDLTSPPFWRHSPTSAPPPRMIAVLTTPVSFNSTLTTVVPRGSNIIRNCVLPLPQFPLKWYLRDPSGTRWHLGGGRRLECKWEWGHLVNRTRFRVSQSFAFLSPSTFRVKAESKG